MLHLEQSYRFRKGKGPRPLRTRSEPWGRTDIRSTPSERSKLDLGTALLRASLDIIGAVCLAGGIGLLEHPRDPGCQPYPSIWVLPGVMQLSKRAGLITNMLDQCRYGQKAQKATTVGAFGQAVLTSSARELLSRRCNHWTHEEVLSGQNADGTFKTSAAQTYPIEYCRCLSEVMIRSFGLMDHTKTGPDPSASILSPASLIFSQANPGRLREQRKRGQRVPAPPLAGLWLPVGRWEKTYAGLWKETEHTNIQELRAVVGLLRHLGRVTSWWG